MKVFNIVLWFIVYSIGFLNIFLWAVMYHKFRNKTELSFLILLSNILLVTFLIMVLVNAIEDNRLIMMIIVNGISSFFITVPYHIYKSNNVQKIYYLFIPIVFITAVLTHNILIITNRLLFLGLTTMMFFAIPLFPLFRQKHGGRKKESPEYKIIKMGMADFFIALFFNFFFVLAYFSFRNMRYFFSLYFGIFLIVYHIPGLWYCKKNRLPQVKYNKSGLKLLTKRENKSRWKYAAA